MWSEYDFCWIRYRCFPVKCISLRPVLKTTFLLCFARTNPAHYPGSCIFLLPLITGFIPYQHASAFVWTFELRARLQLILLFLLLLFVNVAALGQISLYAYPGFICNLVLSGISSHHRSNYVVKIWYKLGQHDSCHRHNRVCSLLLLPQALQVSAH